MLISTYRCCTSDSSGNGRSPRNPFSSAGCLTSPDGGVLAQMATRCAPWQILIYTCSGTGRAHAHVTHCERFAKYDHLKHRVPTVIMRSHMESPLGQNTNTRTSGSQLSNQREFAAILIHIRRTVQAQRNTFTQSTVLQH